MHKSQLLLFLLLHWSFGIAIENNQCTTFCGELTNISYPFRLQGDPKVCGDSNYELACINNRTILDLYVGKYYVQYIDYTNYTIRLVDARLQKDNCSSLPLRSMSCGYFWYKTDRYRCGQYMYSGPRLSKFVTILSCMKAIDSRFYFDASSCLNGVKFSNSSSTRRQVYAMIDADVSSVEAACTLELMAMIPWWVDGNNLRNYAEIHELMVYGFELSWLPIMCQIHCKSEDFCDIDDKHQIRCTNKGEDF